MRVFQTRVRRLRAEWRSTVRCQKAKECVFLIPRPSAGLSATRITAHLTNSPTRSREPAATSSLTPQVCNCSNTEMSTCLICSGLTQQKSLLRKPLDARSRSSSKEMYHIWRGGCCQTYLCKFQMFFCSFKLISCLIHEWNNVSFNIAISWIQREMRGFLKGVWCWDHRGRQTNTKGTFLTKAYSITVIVYFFDILIRSFYLRRQQFTEQEAMVCNENVQSSGQRLLTRWSH